MRTERKALDRTLAAAARRSDVGRRLKLVIFSTNKDPEDPIEGRVSAAQSQVILRFLYGAVVETWEFLRRPGNQKIIGSYLPALDKDGTAARDELTKYFGSSNLLSNMRNKFSYHFPPHR
jgi:hypothetical protein